MIVCVLYYSAQIYGDKPHDPSTNLQRYQYFKTQIGLINNIYVNCIRLQFNRKANPIKCPNLIIKKGELALGHNSIIRSIY